mmetsp:Transcript_63417/g.125442  ORF Transcript_63417/g.125442 Transcript_63417/m.125442 type:complete len:567 (-) Transcript_63417:80-1780(-)
MSEAELSGYKEEVESATSSSSCQGSTFAEGASNVSTAVSAPLGPTAAALTTATDASGKEFEPLFSSESIAEAAAGAVAAAKLGCTVGRSIVEAPSIDDLPSAHYLDRGDPSVKAVMTGTVVNDTFWQFTGHWRLCWSHHVSSEFEWRSCDRSTDSEWPCSGSYEGHFQLQRQTGRELYEEQELELSFTENADGGVNIDGRGKNKFGAYSVRGVVFANRCFEVVKFGFGQAAKSSWNPRLQQSFLQLLQYTGTVPEAAWFRKPVADSISLTRGNATVWYRDIIKTPMDLQTLRDNFKKGRYRTPNDFIADARLIFTNAWTFNNPGDDCYNAADIVYLRFEGKLSDITGEPLPCHAAKVEARVAQHRDAQGQKKRKRASKRDAEPMPLDALEDMQAHDMHEDGIAMTPPSLGSRRQATPHTAPSQRGRRRKAVAYDDELDEGMQELTQEMPSSQLRQVGRARGGESGRGRRGRGRGKIGQGAAATAVERRALLPERLSEEETLELQQRIDALEEADLDSVLDFLTHDQAMTMEDKEFSLDLERLTPARQRALVDLVDLKMQTTGNNGS